MATQARLTIGHDSHKIGGEYCIRGEASNPTERAKRLRRPMELAQPVLAPETPQFTVADQMGRTYTVLNEHHAQETREPDLMGQKIEQVTSGDLRDTSPLALVYIHEQYYWTQDVK